MIQHPAPAASSTDRRRKVQAVLAGGVVLGIGTAVTLAAWNDSEFALGTFGSATFNLEGSTDGETFADNDTEEAAAVLEFAADNVIPGETLYAPFWVQLDDATTVDGTIEAADGISIVASDGANADFLSYAVYADPASCDADGATGGDLVASGEDLSEGVGSEATLDLAAGDSEPGTPIQLCFVVQADATDLLEDEPASAVWQVRATSLEG